MSNSVRGGSLVATARYPLSLGTRFARSMAPAMQARVAVSASLMPKAFEEIIEPHPEIASVLNYGINSLRFLEPVRVNDRVRYVFKVANIEQKPMGKLFTFDCVVEIDRRSKPALVGQFLTLAVIRSVA